MTMNFGKVYLDLNKLFDWNVKQLFLYLIAEYTTPINVSDDRYVRSSPIRLLSSLLQSLNQVILWDKILLRGQNAHVDVRDIATKYYFWDDGEHLRSDSQSFTG